MDEELLSMPLDELLSRAWELRKRNFPDVLHLSAPSLKRYISGRYSNTPSRFVSVSVTGGECALRCKHCGGRLLESMHQVSSPEELVRLGERLVKRGGRGVLVSGGADARGCVPLRRFAGAMRELRRMGLRVIVHSGIVGEEDVDALRRAGVEQVLLDVIGSEETAREVYHLKAAPEDYLRSMRLLREAGIRIAPHVVVGLHGGRVVGEYRALEMISEAGAEAVVVVALSPIPGTAYEGVKPPAPEEVARVVGVARVLNPGAALSLGCARAPGDKLRIERLAVDAGVNTIAYPTEEAVEHAERRGLRPVFSELCCTLVHEDG